MQPSPWTVPLDPILAAGVVAVGGIAVCAARAGKGARAQSVWRRNGGWVATVLLVLAWLSPLQTIASHYLLTAHLLQVTLVMGVVPPLLLLALPERPVTRGHRHVRRLGRALVHPVVGMAAINAAFFGWHLPAAYDAALHNPELYAVQQVCLLVASMLFWWAIVVPLGGRRTLTRWATLGYIFVATIPQTFGGITVALARHVLYPAYSLGPHRFGLTAMTDQQVAGACIALVSKIALFTAFGIVFMRMLNEAPNEGDDDGGGGGRRPGTDLPTPPPSGCVPWLADLNAGRTVTEPAPRPRRVRVPAAAGPRPR